MWLNARGTAKKRTAKKSSLPAKWWESARRAAVSTLETASLPRVISRPAPRVKLTAPLSAARQPLVNLPSLSLQIWVYARRIALLITLSASLPPLIWLPALNKRRAALLIASSPRKSKRLLLTFNGPSNALLARRAQVKLNRSFPEWVAAHQMWPLLLPARSFSWDLRILLLKSVLMFSSRNAQPFFHGLREKFLAPKKLAASPIYAEPSIYA